MNFICVNWTMTCWSTLEHYETTLGIAINGCCMVSDRILHTNSTLSVSVETLKISCAEPDDLLSHLHLMCIVKKLNVT